MAGAAIGVVALFLAVASFGVNANTDSNDGECVLLLFVVFFFFSQKHSWLPRIKKRCISSWFSLVFSAINGCERLLLVCVPPCSGQSIESEEQEVRVLKFRVGIYDWFREISVHVQACCPQLHRKFSC
jgi:hypothetical protein